MPWFPIGFVSSVSLTGLKGVRVGGFGLGFKIFGFRVYGALGFQSFGFKVRPLGADTVGAHRVVNQAPGG